MKPVSLSGQVSDLDIKLLRVFKTVVDCGGISAAEVELNIGRSAISRKMSDLEARLDMRLCQRGRSGFYLTDHGRLVYEAAQQLFIDLEKFRANINAAHRHLVGELNIALTDNMVTDPNSVIIQVFEQFHQQEPKVTINLRVSSPNEVERAVIEERANLGIIPYHHKLAGLSYHDLHEEASQLYCGVNHDLFTTNSEQITLEKIAAYNFIAPGYAHAWIPKAVLPHFNVSAISHQAEGVASLVLSGQYLGFLPTHYAQRWVDQGKMHSLLPEYLSYFTPFKAITRQKAKPNPLRSAFLNALLAAV